MADAETITKRLTEAQVRGLMRMRDGAAYYAGYNEGSCMRSLMSAGLIHRSNNLHNGWRCYYLTELGSEIRAELQRQALEQRGVPVDAPQDRGYAAGTEVANPIANPSGESGVSR